MVIYIIKIIISIISIIVIIIIRYNFVGWLKNVLRVLLFYVLVERVIKNLIIRMIKLC